MADDDRLRDYLKRVTVDLHDTRRRLREIEQQSREPVAIVGMSCRYPGGVRSPQQLWDLVERGEDAISSFPDDRGWDLERLYHPERGHRGTCYASEGGFVYDVGEFDASFFGISPREALAMDPKQRLLLEASWEALEDADIDPLSMKGSDAGVFTGVGDYDYSSLLLRSLSSDLEGYIGIGTSLSVASGRISYSLGLEGPAVSIDTACSSSLVALHLACGALRARECGLAFAGGATVISTPATFVEFARQGGLAPDGRCKSFAQAADGAGWGEGVGLLLLELLSDAQRNGHPVLGVIRASAVNQDGASNGLTAPNGPSQQRVIRKALASAGISERQVDLVEAHGTGTMLGDPIEAQALIATYGANREPGRPLWLGSIKSNIGHTMAAAGVAGVIKAVMSMRRGVLPKTLHVDAPSSKVDWSSESVSLLCDAMPWERNGEPRRAGVSSFGMSGTNVHVILEEAPTVEDEHTVERRIASSKGSRASVSADRASLASVSAKQESDRCFVGGDATPWIVSARSADGLRGQADRLRAFVSGDQHLAAGDVASALLGRAQLEHRAVVVGSSRQELIVGLDALADGAASPNTVQGVTGRPGAVFLFPGQGSQWVGMARGLLDCSPVFGERIRECEQALAPIVDWKLEDVLRDVDGAPGLDLNDVVQPVLFAVMVSLAALWQACGVRPAAVIGHSQGELAAACVAGALSLEDATRVVALRSRMQLVLKGRGAMMSIAAPQARVWELLERWDGHIGVAAVNGPRSMVLTGENEALSELVAVCDAEGIRTRMIKGGRGASHSPQVEPLREGLLEALESIAPRTGGVGFCSTVTGGLLDTSQLGAEYWYRNMREPVQFEPVVRGLLEQGHRTFIEISAHPVLGVAVQETIDDLASEIEQGGEGPAAVIGSLRRDQGGPTRFLTSLGEAWVRGVEIDWRSVIGEEPARHVSLPTYAFQRRRYWVEPPSGQADAQEGPTVGRDRAETEFWEAVEDGDPGEVATLLGVDEGVGVESLEELLPALSDWRQRNRDASLIDRWRYRIVWKPIPDGAPALSGRWLVAVPSGLLEDDWTVALIAALGAHGADVVPFELDAAACADRDLLASRLEETCAETPPHGVLSLLSLSDRPHPDYAGLSLGIAGTLTLVQALEAAGIEIPLWIVTREAVSVGADDPLNSPRQGMIWGLGRTVALEQPHRWGGLVDLPARSDERSLTRLCAVLAQVGEEDQVAVRPAGLFARRLRRASLGKDPVEPSWVPRGTALITGGTGVLGAHLARWIARAGVPHLLLVSRGGPGAPGVSELVEEIEAIGAQVSVVACDVSDSAQLRNVLASIPEEHPLDAVFHAAGVESACALDALTLEQLQATIDPKANAALHLHELTEELELSAFVLFSSMGATMGSGAQGHQVAANALLDALAEYRHARGLPATSVAWGSWAGEGVARSVGDVAARRGVLAMDPQLALRALRQALDRQETCLTIASIDWERYASTYTLTRARPLLDDLPELRQVRANGATDDRVEASAGALAMQLAPLDERRRERVALELVRSLAAGVLGYGTADLVEAHKAFKELGADSLMAVDLRNRLQAATGLRLPGTLVFDHPTPMALARFLVVEATGRHEQLTAPTSTVGSTDEPIAIVGMSCRYPGGVSSPRELWELVVAGRDAIEEFPADRGWDLERLYHPDHDHRGTSYVREGGFLHDVADFDAGFFGIGPREAVAMDPQQRVLLEACWEAFEDAGLDPSTLRGSATGVYLGCSGQDYSTPSSDMLAEELDGYRAAGAMASMASGRVAYTFGLEGPAVSVDTACSSSLVAMHLACQALRGGECSLALATGVTIMSSPLLFIEMSRQRGLAGDGRCKAFADGADGTGFSDGVGALVLERLSDARRLGHEVVAVVRGSAVNQDGASNGLTAPSGPSQERVIRQALANAGVSAEEVDVVEAHGTGTRLGDPIEAQALLATYGRGRPQERPLWLGSIKSNIGHTSAAAGVAGVIKMAMALRHGVLPPTLHVDEPSTFVDWSLGAVSLLTEGRSWESNGRPRRAGVSSFGASGTNAHLIVEEAPSTGRSAASPERDADTAIDGEAPADPPLDGAVDGPDRIPLELLGSVVPWVLSGRGEEGLRGQAGRLLDRVDELSEMSELDVGFSLATRPMFEDRAVMLGRSREGLLGELDALARDEHAGGIVRGLAPRGRGGVVFLFPGQGSQWVGMGVGLLDASSVFAGCLRECGDALAPFVDWSLEGVLRGEVGEPGLERVDVVQPVLFAVMVSLAGLWRACGVVPDAVVGHSQGEIAAACVSGGLSLGDAARVVALRSRALSVLAGRGGMVSVGVGVGGLIPLLEGCEGSLAIAAVNGPSSVVVSGGSEAIEEFLGVCAGEGVRARRIPVDYAAHSEAVEGIRGELLGGCESVCPRSGEIPFYSTVSGGLLDTAGLDGEYWYRNLRETVQLEQATRSLLDGGHGVFIEISPHPVLTMGIGETIDAVVEDPEEGAVGDAEEVVIVGSLRRGEGGPEHLVSSLAEAWVRGVSVDWGGMFAASRARRVRLPTYAFQRKRFWLASQLNIGYGVSAGLGAVDTRSSLDAAPPPIRGVLARRLWSAPEDQRKAMTLEFVLEEVALVLGHESSEAIDPKRALLELGFDSLKALELRNRLSVATGLSLPNTLAFDHPTPAAIAGYIAAQLVAMGNESDDEDGASGDRRETGSSVDAMPTGGLTSLFHEAYELGKLGDFTELLMAASRFRPTFDVSPGPESAPGMVRLSEGDTPLELVCFPSVLATSGPHEYAGFAQAFRASRSVSVLPIPGYVDGERLPANFDVLVRTQAEAIRSHTAGGSFALVGYSSGGILAHAVAGELESMGLPPAAVVLIDTYTTDLRKFGLTDVMFKRGGVPAFVNDARLTAMGAYLGMVAGWSPVAISAPVLLTRAVEPVPGIPPEIDWRSSWELDHAAIDIQGHHFTIMDEHAQSTAQAVQEWIGTLAFTCG